MPSKAVAIGVAVVGLLLMIICAPLTTKYKDKDKSTYNGLIAGSVIGGVMILIGLGMYFMGGSSGKSNSNSNSNNGGNSPSEKIGSDTAIETKDPLNLIEKTTHKTALVAAMNAENAKGRVNAAEEAVKTVQKLGGLIKGLG